MSSYLDLHDKSIKTPLSDDGVPRYALNHPHDLLTAIRHIDNNVYLNEALLDTWPSDETIKLFRSTCKKILPKNIYQITFDQLYSNSNNCKKIIDCYSFGPNGDALIAFNVPYMIKNGSDEVVKKLTDAMYAAGYILSLSENVSLTSKMKSLGVGICFMQFEARYSRPVFNFSKYLYHVSPIRYFGKICERGLVPSSKNTKYKYPDRIYLFNQSSVAFVRDYGVVKSIDMIKRHP